MKVEKTSLGEGLVCCDSCGAVGHEKIFNAKIVRVNDARRMAVLHICESCERV